MKSGSWSPQTRSSPSAMASWHRSCRSTRATSASASARRRSSSPLRADAAVRAPPAGLLVQRLGERRVYISGLLIVAVSTGACAFAETYWQLLLFRSLGGLGSAMFTVSSLGLMIRISPADARGRVAGLFTSAFLVGSVGGPVLGSLTVGLGLRDAVRHLRRRAADRGGRRVRQPAALSLAAPDDADRAGRLGADGAAQPRLPGRAIRRTSRRAGRRSGCGSRWFRCSSSRCSTAAPGCAGLALATFAIGNVSAVIPSGYLSDRVGRRLPLLIGLPVSAVGDRPGRLHDVAAAVPRRGVRDRSGNGHLHLAAAGGRRRHRWQQGPRRHGRGDVPDDVRLRRDPRLPGSGTDRGALVLRLRRSRSVAASCWWPQSPGCSRPRPEPRPSRSTHRPGRWVPRPVAKCRDLRF